MDFKQIQELIRFVCKSGASEVKIEQGDFKITIKTKGSEVVQVAPVITQPVAPVITPVQAEQPKTVAAAGETKPETKTESVAADDTKLITIKSPMIGTFYRSPAPDKEPFVKVGDTVTKGTVLCIIEAMKLFNEIESEYEGKIVKVLVEDASPVEYDQPLFLLEKL
jgi:acetyl-CoA carboxylase biotin carboxyl carrier protein